jgi:hypothetical protein
MVGEVAASMRIAVGGPRDFRQKSRKQLIFQVACAVRHLLIVRLPPSHAASYVVGYCMHRFFMYFDTEVFRDGMKE